MQYNMGIDIGASGARMAVRGRGLVLRQASAVATREGYPKPVAIGNDALNLAGRSPLVHVDRPTRGGIVTRDALMVKWLEYLFDTAVESGFVSKPQVLLAVDGAAQESAAEHMLSLAIDAGAAVCARVRSDMMAALGSGLNVMRPEASLVMDIGASRISISLITFGRIVRSETLPFGMQRIDEAILRILRLRHGLIASDLAAEDLKTHLSSASSGRGDLKMNVVGMKPETGFPAMIEITAEEVADAATLLVTSMCELASAIIDGAPTELVADLNDTGIALTGGGAMLYGVDKLIAEKTGLKCRVLDDPSNATIQGVAYLLDRQDQFGALIETPLKRADKPGYGMGLGT